MHEAIQRIIDQYHEEITRYTTMINREYDTLDEETHNYYKARCWDCLQVIRALQRILAEYPNG